MANFQYFPSVKPSAIALGVVFKTTTQLLIGAVVENTAHYAELQEEIEKHKHFGKPLDVKTVFDDVKLHSSGLIATSFQTYAIAALLSASGTLSYKGATYLGVVVYFASSVSGLLHETVVRQKPFHVAILEVTSQLVETVGLSLFLTYWGINACPLPHGPGHVKFTAKF